MRNKQFDLKKVKDVYWSDRLGKGDLPLREGKDFKVSYLKNLAVFDFPDAPRAFTVDLSQDSPVDVHEFRLGDGLVVIEVG